TPPEDYIRKAKKRFLEHGRPDQMYTVAKRQQVAFQHLLDQDQSNTKVYVAYKHSAPQIDDVVQEAINDGMSFYHVLPMCHFHSRGGVEYYANHVRKILQSSDITNQPVILLTGWYNDSTFERMMIERVQEEVNSLSEDIKKDHSIL